MRNAIFATCPHAVDTKPATKISPALVIVAILFLPITILFLIGLVATKIWKHPTWSLKAKIGLSCLLAAAILIPALLANSQSEAQQSVGSPGQQAQIPVQSIIKARGSEAATKQIAAEPSRRAHATRPHPVVVKDKQPWILVNVGAILGSRLRTVNEIIGGRPFDVEEDSPDSLYGFPDGATSREYYAGGVPGTTPDPRDSRPDFVVDFDSDGVAKEVSFIDPGELAKYKLSDWPTVMSRIGMTTAGAPDKIDLHGLSWNSPGPYHIVLSADYTGHITVSEVMLREIQDRGEKQEITP